MASTAYAVAPSIVEGDSEVRVSKTRSRVVLGATAAVATAAVAAALVLGGRLLTKTGNVSELSDELTMLDEAACHTAQPGEQCFKIVQWTMAAGFFTNPSDYPGLSPTSPFSAFQAHLNNYSAEASGCFTKPCVSAANCSTASEVTQCGEAVTEAMTRWINERPSDYPGLTAASSRDDFQRHINRYNPETCPTEPCAQEPYALPTLFCWSVIVPDGYENGLMQAQFENHAGIFSCNDNAIVSDQPLPWYPATRLIDSTKVYGKSKDGFSPNAPTFVKAWSQIQGDGRWSNFDWTVKADPDAVIIPSRLRMNLEAIPYTQSKYVPDYPTDPNQGVWITNCDKMLQWGKGWGKGWPMMFGSMEVVSRNALSAYFANALTCIQRWDLSILGEDDFLGKCLRSMKLTEYFIRTSDQACWPEPVDCANSGYVVFHPRKDWLSWQQCWNEAMAVMY